MNEEIAITRKEFEKFKETYQEQKENKSKMFFFSFNNQPPVPILVDYAKYLIEYVESIEDENCPISIYI